LSDNDTDSPEWARKSTVSEILSQAEIEALLQSLQENGEGAPTPQVAEAPKLPNRSRGPQPKTAVAYEMYDFRRPDKLSKDQLRSLQMVHETFSRHSATGLSADLRSPVQIDLVSIEQVPYEDYLRGIENSAFAVMSLPPLTGQAVLEIEFGLLFCMIDRILGGPGRPVSRNLLTDIERPLVKQIVERFLAGIKTAWEGVVIINPGIEQMETTSQFVQIAPPNDVVVTILFECRVGDVRGAMSICVPYLVLKPITAKLSAQKWFTANNKKHNATSRRQLSQQILHTTIDCSVMLGQTRMNVRDFMNLRAGDLVPLNRDAQDELELWVSKTPKFLGKPATVGKRMIFTVSDPIQND